MGQTAHCTVFLFAQNLCYNFKLKNMKKIYTLFLLTSLLFGACKKNTDTEKPSDTAAIKTNMALFLDTFRVYNSDLEGNGLKVSLDEDEKSGNNYIGHIAYSQNNKFVYAYKPATGNIQIKTANANGADKKTLKTLTTGVSVGFLGSFGGKVLYATNEFNPSSSAMVNEVRMMDEDGNNDTKLNMPLPDMAAKNGSAYISITEDY